MHASKISVKTIVRKYGVLLALIMVFIVFSLMEPAFYEISNILAIIRQASITGILAVGLTNVVVAGEFDMSFAANATFAGVISILLMGEMGVPAIFAWLIGVVAALGVGVANSAIVVGLGVPSMIETIGMMTLLAGFSKWFTGGATYYSNNFPELLPLLGRSMIGGIVPFTIIIFAVVIIIALVILNHTKLGRNFHAVGGNPKASEHVGINVKKTKVVALMLCALMAGIAGITVGSLLGSGTPSMGESYLIPSISAMFIGAVFLKDGVPNVWGSVIGAILLSVLSNGFVMINLPFFAKDIVMGAVLIGAVSMVAATKKGQIPGIKLM